ncbi:MAG: DUF4118 domain-containing protein [Clostridia bacterium]|nr:DUF4118 domain-containing protein [Clostridia bacterium]
MKNTLKATTTLLILLSAGTFFALVLYPLGVGNENITMIYLITVLFITVFTRSYIYGITSAFVAVIAFNYLFTEPRYTLNIYSSKDITLLSFFFVTAIVVGTMMSRLQKQTDISGRNEKTAKLLSEISSGFVGITGEADILLRGLSYVQKHSGSNAIIRLKDATTYGNYEAKGNDVKSRYPIYGAAGEFGEMIVYNTPESNVADSVLLFKTIAAQIGVTLDREYMYHEREELRVAMESEKLRSTLLRAVAHDLRSPLTSLSGAGEMLYENFDKLTVEEQKKLSKDISEEMIWLTNIVENILNTTRISESKLILNREYEVVDDIVSEAVGHLKRLLSCRDFYVSLPSEVVEIYVDGKLIAQVLINLLGNALRHTPPDASLRLNVTAEHAIVTFVVSDTGGGIENNQRRNLFQSFTSTHKGIADGQRGIGLGLSICKAIVEAHEGHIWIEDNLPQGTKIIFTLPLEACNELKS